MKLVICAVLLGSFSVALLGPVSAWLSGALWIRRAPRSGVLLWQCIGLGAIVSGIGAGLALAVSRYRSGYASGFRQLVESVFSGHPLQGLGLYDALGLTLAADLLIVLVVVFGVMAMRTVRLRARHRRLLDLVAHEAAAYPGTEFLADPNAIAYCLPGLRARIVLSEGTLTLLQPEQVRAVIEHERGHAHEHHGLVMLPMAGLRNGFGWIPYAKHAPENIALLLEMAADDYSSRRCGDRSLAAALVEMATYGRVPSCALAASGSDIFARVSRLLDRDRSSANLAILTVGCGLGVLLLPLCAAGLAS